MKKIFKIIILVLISVTPFNIVRIFFYNTLLGYRISKKSYIGPLNYINGDCVRLNNVVIKYFNFISCSKIEIEEVSILYFNIFLRLNSIIIGPQSKIGRSNTFLATKKIYRLLKKKKILLLVKK